MSNTKITKKRNYTLDIIRLFALFSVVSVHFFLNSDFYKIKVTGVKMIFMLIPQAFFMMCVPLFIILTGYLQNQKKIKDGYYKGLKKVLIVYFICSIIYSLFSFLYLKKPVNFLLNLFSYKGTKYSWYIEMYIGLFLLIPFLNVIFNNINQKEAKKLIIVLFVLSCIPTLLDTFNFDSLSWWKQPRTSHKYYKLFPYWWKNLYPLMYYYIGAYLSKYKPKINVKKNIILLAFSTIIYALYNYYRSYGGKFVEGLWTDYNSIFIFPIAILVFSLLLNIKIEKPSNKVQYILKLTSDSVLGAYLISCMFDIIVYSKLAQIVVHAKDRIIYAPLTVIIVFVLSLTVSIIIELIYRFITKRLTTNG